MDLVLATKFILALVFGALIGLERESQQNGDNRGSIGGIRTFSLISLLGALAGFFYLNNMQAVFLVTLISLFAFVFGYYIVGSMTTKRTGLTTELSAIFAFLLGFIVTIGTVPTQFVIALLVIIILILSMKSKIRKVILGVSRKEVESFITYAIIALVVLPFLPNKAYYLQDIPGAKMIIESFNLHVDSFGLLEIINPYKLWFIVALITGIDVFGYLLAKFIGGKGGIVLTSTVGGFISSTSTTQSLAQKSKKQKLISQLVGAAILANLASFIQVFVLVSPLNSQWMVFIAPTVFLMIIVAAIFAFYFLTRKSKTSNTKEKVEEKERSIFSLAPALKFAVLLVVIKIITKTCLILFGQSGFFISSMIASLAGLDAILVNLSEMAGKTITFQTALLAFILVNLTNLISKIIFSYMQGKREFANKLMIALVGIIVAAFAGYLLF